MSQLPVIVGFGGISPAGRSSFHHGYRRLILDKLKDKERTETLLDLATLMGLASYSDGSFINQDGESTEVNELLDVIRQQICNSTLIRRIEKECFDIHHLTFNKPAKINTEESISFTLRPRQLPMNIPENWE